VGEREMGRGAVAGGVPQASEILGLLRFNTRVVERENGAHL